MFNDIAAAVRASVPDASFGLAFADLYTVDGAARLDALFVDALGASDPALAGRLLDARRAVGPLPAKEESALLIDVAPHVEDFLARLFGIVAEVRALEAEHHALAPLFAVKRQFVQRKAMNAYKADVAAAFDGTALRAAIDAAVGPASDVQAFELAFARAVTQWSSAEVANAEQLDVALRYAAWAAHTTAGKAAHRGGVLFRAPRKLDFMNLVPLAPITLHGVRAVKYGGEHLRRREGFALTDPGTDLTGSLDQAHYCIICHEQGKDSCSRGLLE